MTAFGGELNEGGASVRIIMRPLPRRKVPGRKLVLSKGRGVTMVMGTSMTSYAPIVARLTDTGSTASK